MNDIETLFTPEFVQELEDVFKSVETLMGNSDFMNFLKLSPTRIRVVNPAVTFTKDAKFGMFDTLSDDEYTYLLKKTEQASDAFHNEPEVCVRPHITWQELNHSLADVISIVHTMLYIKSLADVSKETVAMYEDYALKHNNDDFSEDFVEDVQLDGIHVPGDENYESSESADTEVPVDDVPDVPVTNDDSDLAEFK